MLILSRKVGEKIMVGDNIEVVVAEIRGDKVRIGLDAPGHIPVHRKEVFDAIQAAGQELGGTKSSYRLMRLNVEGQEAEIAYGSIAQLYRQMGNYNLEYGWAILSNEGDELVACSKSWFAHSMNRVVTPKMQWDC